MTVSLVLSCEHGGNVVPASYRSLFRGKRAIAALASHRGFDAGALRLARTLSDVLNAPLLSSTITRLLVDLNRSPGHPQLLSEFSRCLDEPARAKLIALHYEPHRARVLDAVRAAIAGDGDSVCHIAVHSFTARLGSRARAADIGLLYDPGRARERGLCARWQRDLRQAAHDLRVRRNYPYLGKSDGLTSHLRRLFAPETYLGIELEVSQSLLRHAARDTASVLAHTLGRVGAREDRQTAGEWL